MDYANLKRVLDQFTLVYEVVPFRGILDRPRKKITINPAYIHQQAEILMHELLHWLYPKATEEWVRKSAITLTRDEELHNFLYTYCYIYALNGDRHSGIAGMVGTPGRRYEPP